MEKPYLETGERRYHRERFEFVIVFWDSRNPEESHAPSEIEEGMVCVGLQDGSDPFWTDPEHLQETPPSLHPRGC